ncbi:uncharacterized protein [Nicotiana sylvestris]|uniref:uncharacterized protein n=1 Tax=Nicotiana sylvestris TaxID=4096 RepID=UPI00388C6B6F
MNHVHPSGAQIQTDLSLWDAREGDKPNLTEVISPDPDRKGCILDKEKDTLLKENTDEYSRVQSCTTAKEIWDTLQGSHEGTPQVKRSRGTLLYSQYENFTMKDGKTIQEMYTRFTILTDKLKSLGRIILEENKVEKILTKVLPVTWERKITTIEESKNIATLKLDELIVNLTAYELRRQTMKIDTPKKERSLTLKITEGADLEKDEMAIITKDFKKYLMRGKGYSRGASKKTNQGFLKNRPTRAATNVGESSDEDSEDDDGDEQAPMAIGESDEKSEVLELDTTVLDLRSENLKLKLGTGKNKADHTYLTLEENLEKIKDEFYKRDEQIRVIKEDLSKVKHEPNQTCKWNKSSDALSWLQEHHSSNKRELGYGTPAPKWDPKSKYTTLPENKICTHYGKTGHYKSPSEGSNQIWYMDNGCTKHMTGSKN